eukprot:Nk52_evm2s368 gene=Nk52_evmTU2s368
MVVDLGFVVRQRRPHLLTSRFFPSKVGGRPAWLAPVQDEEDKSVQKGMGLDAKQEMHCNVCGVKMLFLLQIYAPLDSREDCYHRSIFMFCCANGDCHLKGSVNDVFCVLRCQMPRINDIYPFEEPLSDEEEEEEEKREEDMELDSKSAKFLEYEIVTEVEDLQAMHVKKDDSDDDSESEEEEDEDRRLEDFRRIASVIEKRHEEKGEDYNGENWDEGYFDSAQEKMEDKTFKAFQSRIAIEPEQIARYERAGMPLLVSDCEDKDTLFKKVNSCKHCGGEMVFEFQVLPQLLYFLKVEQQTEMGDVGKGMSTTAIDWGTLMVFTCSQSCSAGTDSYVTEGIVRQDISDKGSFLP